MSVTINLGAWRSVFAVPSKIVDEGLKFSDGVKLKVLLYVLRNADKELDNKDISACTGVNVTDIPEALDYWVNMGILQKSDQVYTPVNNSIVELSTTQDEPVFEEKTVAEAPSIQNRKNPTMCLRFSSWQSTKS